MLPRILCEDLCSLNPGVERLTFSVVWKMDDEANILEEWFGRSVICSCIKMAYEHAQVTEANIICNKECSINFFQAVFLENFKFKQLDGIY